MVLPKDMRLKGHRCFDHLYRHGYRYHESSVLLRVVKPDPSLLKSKTHQVSSLEFKCAVAISNKVSKKAVIRNKIRRLIHGHLAKKFPEGRIFAQNWALITLKPEAASKDTSQILKECDRLFKKAGLFQ